MSPPPVTWAWIASCNLLLKIENKNDMENNKKLYRVTLKGMTFNSTGVAYGISYVIAENSDEAYKKVRAFVDKNDLGFSRERELDKVELIADSNRHSDVGIILHL